MLESLVALFILSVALLAIMNLADRSLAMVSVFKDQLIATNLAQEGIELVRQRRDSNFLRQRHGDGCTINEDCNKQNGDGLVSTRISSGFSLPFGPCNFLGIARGCRPDIRSPSDLVAGRIDFNTCDSSPPGLCQQIEQNNNTGFYGYDLLVSGGETKRLTQFDRRITVERVLTEINPGDPCCRENRNDLRVTSTVTWPVRFSSVRRSVTLETYLTDHHP